MRVRLGRRLREILEEIITILVELRHFMPHFIPVGCCNLEFVMCCSLQQKFSFFQLKRDFGMHHHEATCHVQHTSPSNHTICPQLLAHTPVFAQMLWYLRDPSISRKNFVHIGCEHTSYFHNKKCFPVLYWWSCTDSAIGDQCSVLVSMGLCKNCGRDGSRQLHAMN